MIYKYFSNIDFVISSILESQLWFSRVEDFNDPFEWAFPYKIDVEKNKSDIVKYVLDNSHHRTPEYIKYKIYEYLSNPKKLEDELNLTIAYRRNKGVCCFTKEDKLNSILMWAHYAGNHKGIVLGFDEENLTFQHIKDRINGTIITKTYASDVKYINNPRSINPFDEKRPNIKEVEFIKSEDWSIEAELRIVSPLFGLHNYNTNSLKEIIFGLRTPEPIIQKIISLKSKTNKLEHVHLKQCKKHQEEIKIEIKVYSM